jgi:hypothetical protein
MTLDSNRTHVKMILQEVAAGAVFLNLALHDLCALVASPGSSGGALRPPRFAH